LALVTLALLIPGGLIALGVLLHLGQWHEHPHANAHFPDEHHRHPH
jgi:ABC-type Fe3+ transport system permease subunit